MVSEASLRVSELFSQLGVMVDPERSGPLNIRTHSGPPLRWGHGWFGAIRDGGVGWFFAKNEKAEVDRRVEILSKFFGRPQSERLLAIEDGHLSIELFSA